MVNAWAHPRAERVAAAVAMSRALKPAPKRSLELCESGLDVRRRSKIAYQHGINRLAALWYCRIGPHVSSN
jgi:hypothetical protein